MFVFPHQCLYFIQLMVVVLIVLCLNTVNRMLARVELLFARGEILFALVERMLALVER